MASMLAILACKREVLEQLLAVSSIFGGFTITGLIALRTDQRTGLPESIRFSRIGSVSPGLRTLEVNRRRRPRADDRGRRNVSDQHLDPYPHDLTSDGPVDRDRLGDKVQWPEAHQASELPGRLIQRWHCRPSPVSRQ